MKKYIAFGLYQRNEKGGHQEATGPDDPKPGEAKHVYLSIEVDGLLKAIKRELDDDDLSVARRMIDTALMVPGAGT